MNVTAAIPKFSPATYYRLFKYLIYCLLATNIFLFFHEEYQDSIELYGAWFPAWNTIDAYSATIDTFSWVVLLLLFELETAVIPDEKLQGGLKWILMGIRSISYLFIVYAFYGYCLQYGIFTNVVLFQVEDVCSLLGAGYSYVRVDNYVALTEEVCLAMQGQELVRMAGTQIISSVSAMNSAVYLSIVDIVNAGDWLIIVFLLEVEVYLQLKDKLTDKLILISKFVKSVVYFILFACAVYWGFEGEFLDFWDAFLWLVAFIFIEMNLFQWHAEKEEQEIA
jgi:hypothetical protein